MSVVLWVLAGLLAGQLAACLVVAAVLLGVVRPAPTRRRERNGS